MKRFLSCLVAGVLLFLGAQTPHAQVPIYTRPASASGAASITSGVISGTDVRLRVQTVNPNSSGTQGAATPLGFGLNIMPAITTGPAWAVILPTATGSGAVVEPVNRGSWFVVIFPQVGQQISFFGANTGYAQYPVTKLRFIDASAGRWELDYNIASVFPVTIGVTAHAGGGQASATLLQYGSSVIATCATAGDSVMLPIALGAGEDIVIFNNGAASCNIFPSTGGQINNLATNASFAIPPGRTARFTDLGPPNFWAGGLISLT